METEIKLLLRPGERGAVESDPALAGTAAETLRLVSTYFDTPDLALRARGAILRIRETPDGLVETVKGPDRTAGFASRREWERPVVSTAPDPAAPGRDPEARALLGADLDRLGPVFVTEIARSVRRVAVEGTTEIEVALDEGEARAGDRRAPLLELELELKAGPPGPLYRLAADLVHRHGLRFGPESKAERGYALLTERLPPHPGVADLALEAEVGFAEALPRMVAAGARDVAADLARAARGDIEGIHRLRAAIRKLRTLFVLFAPHLDRAGAARLDEDLRTLGRTLGEGRDWDVFLTETLAEAEADLGEATLAPLREGAAEHARAAHAAVATMLDGPLPTELLLGLALWTAGRGWLADADDPAADAPLRYVVPDLLDRLEHRVRKRGRRIRTRDGDALHDLRKAMKKLRYASEDVSSLFRAKQVSAYVGRIKTVLADLGRVNDAAVAETRLAAVTVPGDAAAMVAAEALLAWNGERRDRATRRFRRHWLRFRRDDPFW